MRHTYPFPLVAFLIVVFVSTACAQDPPEIPSNEVVRIDANLITVPTQVMDRDGRFITDLKKEHFQIFEDGVEQEIAFFDPVEEPFTILFLLDVSGSMGYYLEDLVLAANKFFGQLRPNDRIIAISFCEEVKTLTEVALVKEIKGIKQFKLRACHDTRTYVYDAVAHALKKMRKIPRRKAIVLFSAGFSSNRDATAKSTLRQAEEQEAVIYTIQFNTSHGKPPRYVSKDYYETIKNANNYMAGLAQKTGGRHYRIEDLSDLAKTFASVADELRRQYTLGYYPKRPLSEGQRRQITVKVRRTGVVVRARDSYVAVPPQQ